MPTGAYAAAIVWGMNIALLFQFHHLHPPSFRVHVFDVGQGDSLLITSPSGKHILVDGGPDLSLVRHLARTLPFFDRTIDLLIITHPNTDHLAALPRIIEHYRVRAALLPPIFSDLPMYRDILAALTKNNSRILRPTPDSDIRLGDGVVLDVLWPPVATQGEWLQNANNTSIVLRAMYGKNSILLTGDIEKEAEMEILASGADLHTTILKVAHHGSTTSTSTGFLLASSPKMAIISAGRNNRYEHPHPSVMARLLRFGVATTTTAEKGTIVKEF